MDAIDLAFRARCVTLVVCTTGVISLAATTTGYTRPSGSFVTDGFKVGQEITPTGFATNTPRVIKAVTATTITTTTAPSAETESAGRSLSVGLPALRGWDNLDFTPERGRPFIEADFVPATATLRTGPAQGGTREETGLYVVRWYGLSNTGASNIRHAVTALGALFTPGTTLTAGGDVVRVRSDVAPFASAVTQRAGGWALCTLTIPWRVHSANVVAA